MRINSDDKLSYIDMVFGSMSSEEDTKLTGRHDVQLSIEASCKDFRGYNGNIWFGEDDIRRFAGEIKDLENQRKGAAKLASLGHPSEHTEFVMEIYSTDNAGHLAVKFDLQKLVYSRHLTSCQLSASFDLDPGDLLNLVTDFEALFSSEDIDVG